MSEHDMQLVAPSGKGLIYNGTAIRDKAEMLSLTDMWKAAGSIEGQRPDDWKKDAGNRAFLEHVALISNAPVEGIWKGRRGNNGGTMAHWQVGVAYAKTLNHDFHMWCNSVVRAHMEGAKPVQVGLSDADRAVIGGIVKSCAGVVIREHLANLLPELLIPMVAATLAQNNFMIRRGKTAKQIWDAAGMPPKIKGSTNWFGNRLKDGGCMLEGKADNGNKAVRLFDPDKAETLLHKLGLLHRAKVYASERMGQRRFKLVQA